MAQIKCAFKAAVEDLSGATCKVGEGETFDIAAALKEGNGQIVLDLNKPAEAQIADALRTHDAVTEIPVKSTNKKES